jgi:hypothetical protein
VGRGRTVTDTIVDFPRLLAEIRAVPGVIPVTIPSCETVATATLSVDQKTRAPLTVAPSPSMTRAVIVRVSPMIIESAAGSAWIRTLEESGASGSSQETINRKK